MKTILLGFAALSLGTCRIEFFNSPPMFDRCMVMRCRQGYFCKDSQCQLNSCRKCQSNQKCNQKGQCIGQLCGGQVCPTGQFCINKKCTVRGLSTSGNTNSQSRTKQIRVCPKDAKYEVKHCKATRPSLKSCPVLNYIRAPDPLFCGIKADGTKINFPRECEACMQKGVDYYFTAPCHKTPFVLNPDQQCLESSPTKTGCKNNEECPYDWQMCHEDKCIDSCATRKCPDCQFGRCKFQQAHGNCKFGPENACNSDDWTCVGFECADVCLRKSCPAYHSCNRKTSQCQPIKQI